MDVPTSIRLLSQMLVSG